MVERAVALEQTPLVLPESLPTQVRTLGGTLSKGVGSHVPSAPAASAGLPDLKEGFDLEALGEEFYRHYIALALEEIGRSANQAQRRCWV